MAHSSVSEAQASVSEAKGGSRLLGWLRDLSVPYKLFLTYAIIVAVIFCLSAFTAFSSFLTRKDVSDLAVLARHAVDLSEAELDALTAQDRIKQYVISPDAATADQVREKLEGAAAGLETSSGILTELGEAEELKQTRKYLTAFQASFDRITSSQMQIQKVDETTLQQLGPSIAGTLRDIMTASYRNRDPRAAYYAGRALDQYMQVRIDVARFISSGRKSDADSARSNLLNLEEALNQLYGVLSSRAMRRQADQVIANLVTYDEGFGTLAKLTEERDGEVSAILSQTGPAFEQSIDTLRQTLVDHQDAAATSTISQLMLVMWQSGIASMVGIALAIGAALMALKLIVNPIRTMAEAMHRLAAGDRAIDVGNTAQGDEIGEMARAVQVFKDNAIAMEELQAEQAANEAEQREAELREREAADERRRQREQERQAAEEEKRRLLSEMADHFESSVKHVVEIVFGTARRIEDMARLASDSAQNSVMIAADVASTSEQASQSVATVAAATEQMSHSISEVSSQVASSTSIAKRAVERAKRTDEIVASLASDARRIGEIVSIIQNIAGQTNLLALNATIEAARAGDAGRGFAVVASEVKALATQTAGATDEIAQQINSIQTVTNEAVDAIREIQEIINEVSSLSSSVAAAVEEQAATTQEISRNTQHAAKGTHEVVSNILMVREGVDSTGEAAQESLRAAAELAEQAAMLQGEVDRFLERVRAA